MLRIEEAATELNFTPRAVYEWIRTGKIKAVKIMSEWRIPQEEIDRLKAGVKDATK